MNAPRERPCVLHVSGDFPDTVEPFKTPVIRDLVDLTSDLFGHEVISLNRVGMRTPELARFIAKASGKVAIKASSTPFDYGHAVEYRAPGRGLLHATMLHRLADWMAQDIAGNGTASLLVGHKLSIEGLVVYRLAQTLGLPFAVCLQGDTDSKIIAARPDLRRAFSQVYHDAAVVFPFTPWIQDHLDRRLGKRTGPTRDLPCPTELDSALSPVVGGNGLISVFHLKNAKRKNLHGMMQALQRMGTTGNMPELTVLGGGSPQDLARCTAIADKAPIRFAGPVARDAMAARMNAATGLVLPSLRESFGLVFVEALFAGIPVVYPAGQAVTGYFDGCPFAIPVDPRDPAAIASAMQRLIAEEGPLKASLARWQTSTDAARFRRPAIGSSFAEGLELALGSRTDPALA